MADEVYDYVVVGSGAGGGTVAARLAEAGHSVLVLEAGGDPRLLSGGNALRRDNALVEDYDVPAFHACVTENEAIAWNYRVRHYADDAQQALDPKCLFDGDRVDGILYPRAAALGGCTAHNAMILVCPDNEDWERIARDTADPSWSADNMRDLFRTLECCGHRPFQRLLGNHAWSRHGFDGWLRTETAIPLEALRDRALLRMLHSAIFWSAVRSGGLWQALRQLAYGHADPNDWRRVRRAQPGLFYLPLTTAENRRIGTRERLLAVAREHPLAIELNAHATRVVLDGRRAIGVDYLKGERLYRAFKPASQIQPQPRTVRARREVIVAAGAFNTPQLLMLSGIGPAAELARHGIAPMHALEGVGRNLQDRYEVGLVYKMAADWEILHGATFCRDDPQCARWAAGDGGVYASNGALLAVIRRSSREHRIPDVICFALLGAFRGYAPRFSHALVDDRDRLTWAVLKGHTNNRAGRVRLRSDDPLDMPCIDFHYFDEGSAGWEDDLASVVSGVKFVRNVMAKLIDRGVVESELAPGVDGASDAQIAEYVRGHAWGHHASSTCAIGPVDDPRAVVDSRLRVHGIDRLRIADASVFPRIPGLFIASAVYLVGEKAAQAILADAHADGGVTASPRSPAASGMVTLTQ